jgi:hypothetical protein
MMISPDTALLGTSIAYTVGSLKEALLDERLGIFDCQHRSAVSVAMPQQVTRDASYSFIEPHPDSLAVDISTGF